MPDNIVIIAALVIPIVVLTILRINAAMVFLSLCLGYVLVTFVANDANSLISFVAPNTNSPSSSTLRLGMLFTPVILTSLIMVFSLHGRVRVLLNMIPAAGVAVLGLLLAVPLLTPSLRNPIQIQQLWTSISQAQAMIVGISAFASLVFLWTQRRGFQGDEHSRRR